MYVHTTCTYFIDFRNKNFVFSQKIDTLTYQCIVWLGGSYLELEYVNFPSCVTNIIMALLRCYRDWTLITMFIVYCYGEMVNQSFGILQEAKSGWFPLQRGNHMPKIDFIFWYILQTSLDNKMSLLAQIMTFRWINLWIQQVTGKF